MRILVDIPEDDLSLLNQLSKAGDVPRAELVRQAIARYLEPHRLAKKASAFGRWADQLEDGREVQKRMRDEW